MKEDSPLQRILASGYSGAAIGDLLAAGICRAENDALDAEQRSRELLRSLGGVKAIGEVSKEQIRQFTQFSELELMRCLAWLELGRRSSQAGKGEPHEVMSPDYVFHLLRHLQNEKQEHFVVVLLDAKNVLIKWSTIHIGTLTASIVGPREVFREAIREGACNMILAHNHPSGDPDPSQEDIAVTRKLAHLGEMLDIRVWDHVIIGFNRWASLRSRGLFDAK